MTIYITIYALTGLLFWLIDHGPAFKAFIAEGVAEGNSASIRYFVTILFCIVAWPMCLYWRCRRIIRRWND